MTNHDRAVKLVRRGCMLHGRKNCKPCYDRIKNKDRNVFGFTSVKNKAEKKVSDTSGKVSPDTKKK
jgi:hypothetical protein